MLRKLEKQFEKELVVIGVHSAKFTTEQRTANIRMALLRHGLKHPVVNDSDFKIWRRYGVRAWPTLVLVDPRGNRVWSRSGEQPYERLSRLIQNLIQKHDRILNRTPIRWAVEKQKETTLSFPGKIIATRDKLIISDTNHHRLLVTNHEGEVLQAIGSSEPGWRDGNFSEARFTQPQGTLLDGDLLFVADTENHRIRVADLKEKTVRTIAGTGEQAIRKSGGPALTIPLNSPWDLAKDGTRLFIAMAGNHSIWVLHLEKGRIEPFAGDGRERLKNGTRTRSSFNQPSGLTILGKRLYVADSEISGVRGVDLGRRGRVNTIVGTGLFDFGDRDGRGMFARLQHVLGIHAYEGKLYVTDSYNHKIKIIDPKSHICRTLLGDGRSGLVDGKNPRFYEPSGLYVAAGKLFIADQNNHAIRVADLKTKEVKTLKISGAP